MKYRNIIPGIKISYVACVLFLLLGITSANAQAECKRKLIAYNQRPDFPTGQLADYVTCLTSLETYYMELAISEQINKDKIVQLKAALNQNKISLNQARQAKDSIGVNTYTKKKIDLNKELETLNKPLPNKNEYKTTLVDSYRKIIAYYTNIEDPKKNDYQRKLDTLNSSN